VWQLEAARFEENPAMMRTPTSLLAASAMALALLAATERASANCAAGDTFSVDVQGNRVTVCPEPTDNNAERICPDPQGGMLRQNTTSGEVVHLADTCGGSERYQGAADECYVDECVPAGTYRYGFATPWQSPSCSTCPPSQYFGEVEVVDALPVECTPSLRTSELQPFAGAVPWGTEGDMCNESAWGCSLGSHPREVVFGVNAILAALGGLAMMRRRRSDG
jgi:hypothetical protein